MYQIHKQLQNGKKKTCNLGEMYSYWANSTVYSSGVAGNHRSWKIYLSQKSGTTKGLFLEHWLFYVLLLIYWLVAASLWCHQSILLLWWVMEMNVCKVVRCDCVVITSCIVLFFKGTLNKHWNTERTTSAIKRKNGFIEMVFISN